MAGCVTAAMGRFVCTMVTFPGGVPLRAKSLVTFVGFTPVLTMYSVVVGLRDCTGWTDTYGDVKELRSILESPATSSLLLMTQMLEAPSLRVFVLMTILSSLTPSLGWSPPQDVKL